MSAIGRKCSVVNLDPANEQTSYPCGLDVRELVTLEEIMQNDELGPNGSVLYALEELEQNFDWLAEKLKAFGEDYVLFDCPGQVELFTHHASLRNIFFKLQKIGYRVSPTPGAVSTANTGKLVVVHLIDSYVLTLPSLYISALLLSLRTMLQMDLPHINVLSKIDNLYKYPKLPFNLDFYTEVQDLSYLLPHLEHESPMFKTGKFSALNQAVTELIEEFCLVSFETLVVEDKKSMIALLQAIDRAGGYAFGSAEGANDTVWQVAVREGMGGMDVRDVQERWIDDREFWDERESREREEEAAAMDATGEGMPVTTSHGIKVVRTPKM